MANPISTTVNLFISPRDAFESINERPSWGMPCAVILIVSVCIGFLLLPFAQKVIFNQLVAQSGMENAKLAMSLAQQYYSLNVVLIPLSLFVKWFLLAVVFYYSAVLFNSVTMRFNSVFSVIVHSEYILLLMGIVNIALLHMKGTSEVTNINDLQSIVGLDYIFRDSINNYTVLQVLKGINIFTVWYITLLIEGTSKICDLRLWKSSVIVSIVWIVGVASQLTMAMKQ